VEVVTAAKLGDDELNKICNLVQESYKGKTLEFTYTINPDIIGGFIINVDSIRMDASISNEIEQLRLNLLSRN
jgi:F-type H+-transporting ATPase subunit delta